MTKSEINIVQIKRFLIKHDSVTISFLCADFCLLSVSFSVFEFQILSAQAKIDYENFIHH